MKKITTLLLLLPISVMATELVHEFKSPAFSGIGYSSHIITIEQLESNRRQKIKDDQRAEEDRQKREFQSTNAYKFQNNLESRIYAQLSKQISDKLFGEGATTTDGTWYGAQTPFGDTVSWKRENDRIFVRVLNSNGNAVAEFDVPVGEFAF